MEDALRQWLMDNRPYTRLNTRLKHFALFCKTLQPELGYCTIMRTVKRMAYKLLEGDLGKIWMRDRNVERVIREYGQNDQRTSAWHAKRSEMVTASEIYQLFTTPAARLEVMLRKLETTKNGSGGTSNALIWGTRFEPIAKQIYEERTNCKITDVSCVQHPKYSFLGASPDGIIFPLDDNVPRYGRLVEFKCPISRAPKDEIPIGYQYQMQLQMECTGIDECEYVEFRFKQVFYSEWLKFDGRKGFFSVSPEGVVKYDEIQECEDTQCVYWILQDIKEGFVKYDPEWLPKHIDAVQAFWNEVLEHRKNGTLPKKPELPSLDV